MREILFRGRDLVTGEWRYGDFARVQSPFSKDGEPVKYLICNGTNIFNHDVYPKTVGQYTGMKDNAGVKIFEGDIVRLPEFTIEDEHFPSRPARVYWDDGGWALEESGCISDVIILDHECAADITVIGNIWDNPELLEGPKNGQDQDL